MTEEEIIGFLKLTFSAKEKIGPDTSLFMSGLLDSMSMLTLLSFLEESHNISILNDDFAVERFDTPAMIAGYINGRKTNINA